MPRSISTACVRLLRTNEDRRAWPGAEQLFNTRNSHPSLPRAHAGYVLVSFGRFLEYQIERDSLAAAALPTSAGPDEPVGCERHLGNLDKLGRDRGILVSVLAAALCKLVALLSFFAL